MALRILFICNEFPPVPHGRIGVFVKTLSNALLERGCWVWVLGYNPAITKDQVYDENGIKVHWLAKRKLFGRSKILNQVYERFHLTRKMRQLDRNLKLDIVESYDWSGPLLWRPVSAKYIVRIHGAHSLNAYKLKANRERFMFPLEKLQLRLADALCAVSYHVGKSTIDFFGVSRGYEVIYNPVDSKHFRIMHEVRKNYNSLLYIGRINSKKGITPLVKVFNRIHAWNSEIELILVGNGSDEYIKELMLYLTPSCRNKISFIGAVNHEELPRFYNQVILTVLPSQVEAFGLSIIESMACGVAPLISEKSCGGELLDENISGWITDVSDENEFYEKLKYILEHPDEQLLLGANARKRVEAIFDIRLIVESNMNFYTRVRLM